MARARFSPRSNAANISRPVSMQAVDKRLLEPKVGFVNFFFFLIFDEFQMSTEVSLSVQLLFSFCIYNRF